MALEAKGVLINSKSCESTSRMLHHFTGGISQGTKESERQAELALDGYTEYNLLEYLCSLLLHAVFTSAALLCK